MTQPPAGSPKRDPAHSIPPPAPGTLRPPAAKDSPIWQSAAPYVPPVADPEIEAARARVAGRNADRERIAGAAPMLRYRAAALAVDGACVALLALVLSSMLPPSVGVPGAVFLSWLCLRPLAMELAGRTAGHAACGYRVIGADRARPEPGRGLLREALLAVELALGWLYVAHFLWVLIAGATPSWLRQATEEEDGRLPHDVLARTWVVVPRDDA